MPNIVAPDTTPYTQTAKPAVPIDLIIDYIEKGLTLTETAKLLDRDKSTLSRRLSMAGIKYGYLNRYKSHRADILALWQGRILDSVTTDDLQKAGLSQKMMAYGILFDKERLERGQSTANVAYGDVVKMQTLVDSRLKAFEDKYGISRDIQASDSTDITDNAYSTLGNDVST